jgi:glycosyltransferase involved in cell wall biosynthesis
MSSAPLEVVILNDYAAVTGGSTAVALASALELADRGVPVTLFSCVGPVAPELASANVAVVCLDEPEIARDPNRLRAAFGGLRNRRAVLALRRLLAGKSPARTVVHVHTWTKALSPFALAAVSRLGFPLVVTLHDFFITCPTGGFYVHRTGELCHRRPLSASCLACRCDRRNYGHKLWRSARTAVQNKLLGIPRRVDCYIGVSDFSLRVMRPHLPAGARARIVRNPVDCAWSEPAPVGDNREFLYVGRFEAEKGVALAAAAAQSAGLPATFVGDGALREEARRLCPRGRFPGWLPPAAIRGQLQRARALVFPPRWYETLGLVVIEAAAAGVPAIISDECAATDYIRDGVNGLHFRRGSADSLARQMRRLADDPALAARLGRAAYDWYWRDPWTAERHVDELLEVYGEVLGLQPARAAAEVGP